MAVQNAVKKGDVVCLIVYHSATYLPGSGRGTERTAHYTLALVNGANAKGEATSLKRASGAIKELRRKDYTLSEVMTIRQPLQPAALKAFARLTWETDEFDSNADLKAAILKERTDAEES